MKRKNQSDNIIKTLIIIILLLILIFFLKANKFNRDDKEKKVLINSTSIEENSDIVNFNNDENINNTRNQNNIAFKYYYKQLNNNAKIIYDGLFNNKENLKTGNYEIDFGDTFNDLLNSENGNETLKNDFQSAWNAFSYDNVEIFYIDISKIKLLTEGKTIFGRTKYNVSVGLSDDINYFKDEFDTVQEVENAIEHVEKIKNNIVRETNKYINDYEKIKYVHDYLIANLEYEEININKSSNYTIYGALKNNRAVCEGYARTFKYILDELQIPCLLIPGIGINRKNETENHAWNYIMIENKWYAIDITWDDPIIIGNGHVNEDIHYKYFLIGSKQFFSNHREEEIIIENSQRFLYPKLEEQNYIN